MSQPGNSPLAITQHTVASLGSLYEDAGITPAELDFYSTPAWYQNLAANCLGDHETAEAFASDATIVPMRFARTSRAGLSIRTGRSLSNFYSCRFTPIGLIHPSGPSDALVSHARYWRGQRLATLWFDALDEEPKDVLAHALKVAGWWVEVFPQFGNWYLPTPDLSFADYWQARPGALRNTGQRRHKALIGRDRATIHCFRQHADADTAIRHYDAVYAQSWQVAEPYPEFMPTLIRDGLAAGTVEVWSLTLDSRPVATQIWVFGARRATIFKLAYDQNFKKESPGTVLTMAAIESALERTDIDEIDFGWGDDPYKQQWLPLRRQRYGISAYNPSHFAGLTKAVRNLGVKSLRQLLTGLRRNWSTR